MDSLLPSINFSEYVVCFKWLLKTNSYKLAFCKILYVGHVFYFIFMGVCVYIFMYVGLYVYLHLETVYFILYVKHYMN